MLPGAPLFVLPGAMSPRLQKGIWENIRPVELQPENEGVSATPQHWTPPGCGESPLPGLIRVTQKSG